MDRPIHAREVLARAAAGGQPIVLILDQSKLSDRHQVLMLALRHGERALPLAWRVQATAGAIGFEVQKGLLDAVVPWVPEGAEACLMADRFYGTADLISLCQARGWGYRLRLKGTLSVRDRSGKITTTAGCVRDGAPYLEGVELTTRRTKTWEGSSIEGSPDAWNGPQPAQSMYYQSSLIRTYRRFATFADPKPSRRRIRAS